MSSISTIFIILLFIAVDCSFSSSSCLPSSCGNITDIKFPFRLKTDPISCGYNNPFFELDCDNNHTVLSLQSGRYNVREIDYLYYSIRVVDPGIFNHCPANSLYPKDDWSSTYLINYYGFNEIETIAFVHCRNPVNSSKYIKADFCGNKSTGPFSRFYSYVVIGEYNELQVLDVEESCVVNKLTGASNFINSSSLESIYDALNYGFKFSWYSVYCHKKKCNLRYQYCVLQGNDVTCINYIPYPIQLVVPVIYGVVIIVIIGIYGITAAGLLYTGGGPSDDVILDSALAFEWAFSSVLLIAGGIALKFLIGFPIMVCLVLRKWRSRHLSIDKIIEEFLQDQNNLIPIKYSYSEITKMTFNFSQKLGEGRYGIVYKGKLRSGPLVAIKMMEKSKTFEQEFINEVGTIGRIHHANVVQLVGYCVKGSKCALVYEFLPNGSLDRYIFYQQSLGAIALTYEKMFQIALGIARGIAYLHHGCDMQILHFDIKPHNILLDENFHPKISDFGLAKLHTRNESIINLTDVRGTMGYMAPEMFYKNIGGVSYKADIYSFGMLLMEMMDRKKNMNSSTEHMGQICFPSWVYEQFKAEKEIEILDATIEEKKMIYKIILVGLWCIQMKPCDRPPMNKVVEMLEGDLEVAMPPKPFLAPRESLEDHHISQMYSVDCVNLEIFDNSSLLRSYPFSVMQE